LPPQVVHRRAVAEHDWLIAQRHLLAQALMKVLVGIARHMPCGD